jgi:hypothetical protein
MENQNDILVFKTNIKSKPEQLHLKELFDDNPGIHQWNVDTDDVDCVLRIVSQQIRAEEIIKLLTEKGYLCDELV